MDETEERFWLEECDQREPVAGKPAEYREPAEHTGCFVVMSVATYTFTVGSGQALLEVPRDLTAEETVDVLDWLEVVAKQLRRSALDRPSKAEAEG